jgi:hypothetical protein
MVMITRSTGTLQTSTTTSVIPLQSARFCSIDLPSFSSIVISGIAVLSFADYVAWKFANVFRLGKLICICNQSRRAIGGAQTTLRHDAAAINVEYLAGHKVRFFGE